VTTNLITSTTADLHAELANARAQANNGRALLYNASQLRDAAGVARINAELERLYVRIDLLEGTLRERAEAQLAEAAAFKAELSNPVMRTIPLRAYRGWVVREYADGTYDASDTRGVGLTPITDSFKDAVAAIRELCGYRPR
jgi:hypothetical protein